MFVRFMVYIDALLLEMNFFSQLLCSTFVNLTLEAQNLRISVEFYIASQLAVTGVTGELFGRFVADFALILDLTFPQ